MTKAGVIGHPIKHSLSPKIFAYFSQIFDVALDYSAIEILQHGLGANLEKFKKEFIGLNVTLPHKETILEWADKLSPEVQALGAANVLKFENGKMIAFNTDVGGILETLNAHQVEIKGKDIFIIGGGGAARAVAYAVASKEVANVFILNRSFMKSKAVEGSLQKLFPKTRFEAVEKAERQKNAAPLALLVNATPVGMSGFDGEQNPSRFFSSIFHKLENNIEVCFDVIYNPELTPFLEEARRHKIKTIGGLEMLAYQALSTWEIWFGKPAKIPADFPKGLLELLRKNGNS